MSDRRPYDRLPGETAKAYAAFSLYRDMGIERSFESVADQLSKSCTLIRRWAAKYNWSERIDFWDLEQDYQLQQEAIAARREEYKRNLAEFQKNNLGAGKMAFKATATTTKQIMEFVEQNKSIDNWDDANKAVNVIKGLAALSDLWGRALAVDRLLDRLESDDA
jgi:hypothetical protein